MNDPWDVKSVRQSDQYVSCMKINGVPLLPPVLAKECRKEMQYYKLLAKEVENRISSLKPYAGSDDSSEDKTDAPEMSDCEQFKIEAVPDAHMPANPIVPDCYSTITTNVTVKTTEASNVQCPKYVIDLNVNINDSGRDMLETPQTVPQTMPQYSSPPIEIPERDSDCPRKHQKELLSEVDTIGKNKQISVINEIINYRLDTNKQELSDCYFDIPVHMNGPSSLSAKSFTGSLNDLHTESAKASEVVPHLLRQSSYTVLHPSPQLLAHLEEQCISSGVEVTSISMSESLSNLATHKKRRSWDLESAKVKWSSMAVELKRTNIVNGVRKNANGVNTNSKQIVKKGQQMSSSRTRSIVSDKRNDKRSNLNTKQTPKSEPIHKMKNDVTPVSQKVSKQIIEKEPISPTNDTFKENASSKSFEKYKEINAHICTPQPISESDDPATRVRNLYERIQQQQLIQMAGLVEKQKREQMLLQQVFEEQNNLLYKQLKSICPKAPIEIKQAWGDNASDEVRGPVSLSQLMDRKPTDHVMSNPMASTLAETNNYINRCDNVLKKSRVLTDSMKKQIQKPQTLINSNKLQNQRANSPPPGSRTRTHSPLHRQTNRKLNYDTSASSEREYEPILTDRTNDTLADLNVTFPSDSDECRSEVGNNNSVTFANPISQQSTARYNSPKRPKPAPKIISTDTAIRCLENSIHQSIDTMNNSNTLSRPIRRIPTAKEREAATTIVAYAKGFLTRRLMRTERVQGTVQTIRDALLCALQLHQDRAGIRGADVDLHRRLIQQITAACYSIHETFMVASPEERCALIAADRAKRRVAAARAPTPRNVRHMDIMSHSHSGVFLPRNKRASTAALMTKSNYETFSGAACGAAGRSRYLPSPRRRPWR